MKRFEIVAVVILASAGVAFGQYAPPPSVDSFLGIPGYPVKHIEVVNGNFQSNLTVNGVPVLTNAPSGTLTNGSLYATAAQGAKADTALQTESDTTALIALGVASNALHAAVTGEVAMARAAEALLLPKTATNGFTDIVYSNASQFQVAGNYATGTPVYAESDPGFSAWTNAGFAGIATNYDPSGSSAIVQSNLTAHTNDVAPGNAAPHVSAGDRAKLAAAITNVDLSAYASNFDLTAHVTNTVPHVSASDRTNWDGKATLADVAGWSGYTATQMISWSEVVTLTNLSVSGTLNPDFTGIYVVDVAGASWTNGAMLIDTGGGYWNLSSPIGGFWVGPAEGLSPTGTYIEAGDGTGTPVVTYTNMPATITWLAGYANGTWLVRRGGVTMLDVTNTPTLGQLLAVSNAIPTNAAQVGAVPTNDARYLAALTDGVTLSTGLFCNATSTAGNAYCTIDKARSFLAGGAFLYNSTNANPFNTNFYTARSETQTLGIARTYSSLTNGAYTGGIMSTQRFTTVYSPMAVNAYLGRTSGGGDAVSIAPEFYYSYDGTNLLGDYSAQPQAIGTGSNLYQWVISYPTITSTNSEGVFVIRKFKASAVGGTPTLSVYGGGNTPSHLAFSTPPVDAALGVRGATNAVYPGGGTGTYDAVTRTLTLPSLTAAEIAAAGGLVETPYQPYTSTGAVVNGTCTVSFASGSLVKLTAPESPTTLTFDNAGYATNGVNRVAVELLAGTNSIAFVTATITNSTAPTISTSTWTRLIFRRSGNDSAWIGGQVK